MKDCKDHGWECTGLGHEKSIDFSDPFGLKKNKKENNMPIPFEPTCQAFLDALAEAGVRNDLQLLDVRLGLEQILDDPDFRSEANARWGADEPWKMQVGPDSALEKFLLVSDRHKMLRVENVEVGMEAIIDTAPFITEAQARWVRFDANPWPTVIIDDLGADDNAVA